MPLANPVVFSPLEDMFFVAVIALFVEIYVALRWLERFGLSDPRLATPLFFINLGTWLTFYMALDQIPDWWEWDMRVLVLIPLEAIVIASEAVFIQQMSRGRLFSRNYECVEISFRQSLLVSTVANLTSIAVSVILTLLVVTLVLHVF